MVEETLSMKIRVLRIINRFNLGGPTYNVAYLSKYLDERLETLLVGGMKDESEGSSAYILDELGLETRLISNMHRSIKPSADWKAYRELRQIIREYKPDIVHTHASKSGTLGRLAAIHEGVPVILHTFHGHIFHSYFSSLKTKVFLFIERYLAKRSTRIIAISTLQKKELTEEFEVCKPSKAVVIPLGFDLARFQKDQENLRNEFRTKYELEGDEVAIGIIGRLVPVKDHMTFLKAVAHMRAKAKYRVFIIGDGELRAELESKTEELDLSNRVVFTSWITNIEFALAGLDIVALSSLNEGTPVSLIEAQAAKRAIVSTDVGGIENVVIPGESALLSNAGNWQELSKNLQLLADSPQKRNEMAEKGHDFVLERFSYQRLVKDMSDLYIRLLDEVKT